MTNVVKKYSISYELAQKMVDAAVAKARELGVSENVAILDDGGNLKAFGRMDGGIPTMRSASRGYIVNLTGASPEPFTHRGAEFRILTARDFEESTSLRTAISETAHRQASTP